MSTGSRLSLSFYCAPTDSNSSSLDAILSVTDEILPINIWKIRASGGEISSPSVSVVGNMMVRMSSLYDANLHRCMPRKTKSEMVRLPAMTPFLVDEASVAPGALLQQMRTTTSVRGLLAVIILLFSINSFVAPVTALCECGYTSTIDAFGSSPVVFTDLIESDFLHIRNVAKDTDWRRQNYSVTAEAGRGPYGMNFTIDDIASNPILDSSTWTGPGQVGGDPGAQFVVRGGNPSSGYVNVAQMNSVREDLLWGSYRASLKLTPLAGTCSAFFWYFNDTQEIDMEFLSSQFNYDNHTYPVNLVLQSQQAAQQGYNAQGTGNYIISNLPFNPTTDFHEYRIDFVPGKVVYYADGKVLATMNTSAVPSEPGHMILTHWSNGNRLWSAGPPTEDVTMTVAYVKAYFNSSDVGRQNSYASRCKQPASLGSLCQIPDRNVSAKADSSGNETDAQMYFFTDQNGMADHQVYYHKNGVTTLRYTMSRSVSVMFLLLIIAVLLL